MIHGHDLKHHLHKDQIPNMYESIADVEVGKVSIEFAWW